MMEAATLNALINNVKKECAITWADNDTEADIRRIVESASVVVAHKLGISDDSGEIYLEPGYAKMLFERYCHYIWNNVPDEFEPNYMRDIIAARHYYQIKTAQSEEDG